VRQSICLELGVRLATVCPRLRQTTRLSQLMQNREHCNKEINSCTHLIAYWLRFRLPWCCVGPAIFKHRSRRSRCIFVTSLMFICANDIN
jgi:hypothetical protein